MADKKEVKIPDAEIITSGSNRDAEFVKALKEMLSIPGQKGGKTSRRVLMAFQVYHEDDTAK